MRRPGRRRSSATAWNRWRAAEERLLEDSGWVVGLESEELIPYSRVLKAVGLHPFGGARHLAQVLRGLDSEARPLRLLVCATLQRLARARVAPELVTYLRDPDPVARKAVWRLLQSLTGEQLPLEHRAWSKASERWQR